MNYKNGMEVVCIRSLKRKDGQINFIKGETYIIEDTYQKQQFDNPAYKPVYIVLRNKQGSLQSVKGAKKTKYFKIKQEVNKAAGF